MNNKLIGSLVIVMAILFLIVLIIYNIQLNHLIDEVMANSGGTCIIDGECIHEKEVWPMYIGIIIISSLIGVGIYLIFLEKKETIVGEKKKVNIPKNLDEEEKRIVEILNSKEGSAYQSDLIKETEFSKVKITRILDKLEHKNLIDRKRRGMTNIIILK